MLQFWRISTTDAPRCCAAARSTSSEPCLSVSIARATNVASAPIATDRGLKGWSTEPSGVDFVTFPSSDVGEYCPFVSPEIWLLNTRIFTFNLTESEWLRSVRHSE